MKHKVLVVPITIQDHPNGEQIGIVQIDGYTVVVNTEVWKNKKIGAFCPPESILPDKPEYQWLGDTERKRTVKAKKIRGVISYGLLVDAPEGSKVGDDVTEILGVRHYEPDEGVTTSTKADSSNSPKNISVPKYDVESLLKGVELFSGVEVVATEKIHGSSGRFLYKDGEIFIGSRNRWVKDDGENIWSKAYRKNPQIEAFLKSYEGLVLFGEVYGAVKNFHYGLKPGDVDFIAFDVLRNGGWVKYEEFTDLMHDAGILTTFPLYEGVFDLDKLKEIVETDSRLAQYNAGKKIPHIMEGTVVRSKEEGFDYRYGRTTGKIISLRYWNKT